MDFDMTEAEIEALKTRPITYDEDCPPLTPEQIAEARYLMKKYNTRTITREMIEEYRKTTA